MYNLWIFLRKYNAFFLFVIFEIAAIIILVNHNSFQKASYISSINNFTGGINSKVSQVSDYLSLGHVNDSLARENAMLRNQLKSSFYIDTMAKRTVKDTVYNQQYQYIPAKVVSNSTNRRNNYITINIGSKDGIEKDMGVICGSGVVGLVVKTTEHFASIQSLLNSNARVSAMFADTKEIGTVTWGVDLNPHQGLLMDVSNSVKPKLGERVVTSGQSLYPTGIPIGRVSNLHAKEGGLFLNMYLDLAVDYGKLEYVNVVVNKLAKEQAEVQSQDKKDKDE
ncbi:rod shape-determining protein MreC [Mucilaginibacter gracilis]|uniref:Cell shape-determining protein MreC n=1 Tax=Mucilaginibacter gracilis TaxID=423350 RepID=A0A495J9I2_9SPHI|nr:rod shape-determining protein MreC [Mucilaginibacter gracilis]RKR85567.1 rod shape-determining protein MreC [Mucilaginibacter gracilis]